MKKIIILFCCLLSVFSLVACNKGSVSNDILIEVSKSTKFSKDEIENAIQNVKSNFSFPGATLTKIWYDEEKSNYLIDTYLENGRGLTNGVKEENVIILLSNFDVDGSGDNPVLNPNTTYSDYQWILIRDSKNKNFHVGVRKGCNKYEAICCINSKSTYLGTFNTELEAFNAYKTAKESYLKELANKWKDKIDPRAYEALMNYEVEITD